ncbi:MAG TPA: DNA-processing protein DprA, partial [Chitinophagales bacterium]|nr:DNA-processing protein DprA [Chitinophagales bacterium]
VVESAIAGGVLITVEIANNYNRDVFAFPGKVTDDFSKGCLKIIKQHKANLVTCAKDIIESMNWDVHDSNIKKEIIQPQLFVELNGNEKIVYECLSENEKLHIDDLTMKIQLPQSTLSGVLLQMEMKGLISSLPGKIYKLVS